MELLLLRQVLVVASSAIAAATDLKTGEIPDKLTYPLMAIGVLVNLVDFSIYPFAIAAVVFAFGYLLYLSGKIGGGDVKLFAGISLSMPYFNNRIFIVDLLFIAALIALIFVSSYYSAKYLRKGIKLDDIKNNFPYAIATFFLGALYLLFITASIRVSASFIILVAAAFIFAAIFIAFEKGIRREFFLQKVTVDNLEEDEIFAYDFIDEGTKKIIQGEGKVAKGVLGSSEIKRLKEAGIREILVYRNLPKFAPFAFAAAVVVFVIPDLMAQVFFW